jgi:hypothetical protein
MPHNPWVYALVSQILTILPLILWIVVNARNKGIGIMLIAWYLLANLISIRLSPTNQAIHDRLMNMNIVQAPHDDD